MTTSPNFVLTLFTKETLKTFKSCSYERIVRSRELSKVAEISNKILTV